MNTITDYIYIRGGQKYSGSMHGKLTADQVQSALLARRCGCQRVLKVTYRAVRG